MNQPKETFGTTGTLSGQGTACKYGTEHLCSMLDVNDAALILIDHQVGLFNLVRDIDVECLRKNVESLARAAYLADIPVVVTTSKQDSFHGPLIGDLDKIVPEAFLVQRDGEINAWDCKQFVQTIERLQKKTLIMAGTLTNVCLALPAISAVFAGYKVYAVIDASGASSKKAAKLSCVRMNHAHVIITDTLAMVSELMGTFNRKDKEDWWNVFGEVMPRYRLLVENFRCERGESSSFGSRDERFSRPVQDERYGRQDDRLSKDEDIIGGRYGGKDYKETRLAGNRKYGK